MASANGQAKRGQRVLCSPRGSRGGCGYTFSVFLADFLPRHTVTASLLWQWLVQLLAGASMRAAARKLPFALESAYRLRRALRHKLDLIRARLCRKQPPPASTHSEPLLQTVQHLQAAFPGTPCAPASFQLDFQHPFLG